MIHPFTALHGGSFIIIHRLWSFTEGTKVRRVAVRMEDPRDLVPERKINTTEEETTWLRVREDAAARLIVATVFSRDVRCSHVGFSRVSSLFTRKRNWPNPSELTRGKVVEKNMVSGRVGPGNPAETSVQ